AGVNEEQKRWLDQLDNYANVTISGADGQKKPMLKPRVPWKTARTKFERVHHRLVIPFELVFDIGDDSTEEERKKDEGKLTTYLTKNNIPFVKAFTGNRSTHIHVYWNCNDLKLSEEKERLASYGLFLQLVKESGVTDVDEVVQRPRCGEPHNVRCFGARHAKTGKLKEPIPTSLDWWNVPKQQVEEAIKLGSERMFTPVTSKSNTNHATSLRKMTYSTKHLLGFSDLDKSLAIYGDEYSVAKKLEWYGLCSLPLAKTQCRVGDIEVDLRFHPCFVIGSGKGKKSFQQVRENIAKELGLQYQAPTSYHPESLVGKVIRYKTKKETYYEKIPGHFAVDVLDIDEGIDILRSKGESYLETRKYLNLALDPYQQNRITKKAVDVPHEHQLSYYPHVCCAMFLQPYPIPEESVLIGTLRRFVPVYIPVSQKIETTSLFSRLDGDGNSYAALRNFSRELKRLREFVDTNNFFSFSSEAKELFKDLHLELLQYGVSQGPKSRNYTLLTDKALQNTFVKMCAIQAAVRGSWGVNVEDIERAFIDLFEINASGLHYLEKKVMGRLDYGDSLGGAREKDAAFLEWLEEKAAFSFDESTVMISESVKKLENLFKVKER
ncbi:MAG: hypothetical protein GOV15_01975, partial [Candidatus Diapherotrites archaeon]|nr:hypothetical protein [Candidatus Diapherotrites archaeon]